MDVEVEDTKEQVETERDLIQSERWPVRWRLRGTLAVDDYIGIYS